jgi:CubicO group peptidase (beta-lactamase class C family)
VKLDPDGAGLDEGRLERITEHLQTRYLDPQKIAGCQVAVVRHGSLGYWRSFGQRDAERGRPVEDDTIWRLYSMTKAVTAVALMTLYERAMVKLDDPVSRFIPSWRDLQVNERDADGTKRLVPVVRPPTVKDVLMHMAGLGGGLRGAGPDEDPVKVLLGSSPLQEKGMTLERLADKVVERPLTHQPGTRWVYGSQTDVCARLVEVISGERFDDYLRANVFEPLGMADTGFSLDDEQADRFAALYRRGSDRRFALIDDPTTTAYRRTPSLLSGGGGLVGTTGDYLRFVTMLLNGGELDGRRILGRKTVELMRTNHLPRGGELTEFALPGGYGETGFSGTGFGLTFAIDLGPAASQKVGSAGSFSWGGAASTIFWIDPVEDLAVVFMTQLLPSGMFDFRGQLQQLVYGAIGD